MSQQNEVPSLRTGDVLPCQGHRTSQGTAINEYSVIYTSCWAATAKWTAIQRPLLGDDSVNNSRDWVIAASHARNNRRIVASGVFCVRDPSNGRWRNKGAVGDGVFCAVRAEMFISRTLCQLQLVAESWEPIKISCGWGTGTVREHTGSGTFAIGSRYQKTDEDTSSWEGLNASSSEL
jgi:hypothetical protein